MYVCSAGQVRTVYAWCRSASEGESNVRHARMYLCIANLVTVVVDVSSKQPQKETNAGGYGFASTVSEHKTQAGYLFKRGHLLKGWKQRWFVLDSIKHQVGCASDLDHASSC